MSEETPPSDSTDKSWLARISQLFITQPKTRQDINAILKLARDNKLLDADEYAAIEGAMEVHDSQVSDVMVPRRQMIVVHNDETPEEFLPRIIESGHSRFPVMNADGEEVVGILHAKDLLPLILNKTAQDFTIENYLRPLNKVPETKRLNKLMDDFRSSHNHMAVVFDEYGTLSGLITIEDVLEEIVGEISDEFDVEDDPDIKKLSDNDYIVKAQTPIEDFNEQLGADFSDEEVDTIGGFIGQQLGHIPQRGESIRFERFHFKVLHASSRRVHLLRLIIEETA